MPRPKKQAPAEAAPPAQEPAAEPAPAAAADGAAAADKPKKKRNPNPGIRVQGGRVYDSENGTTCHQCRQKTAEAKAKCTKCTLYFCPKCLENRYQEVVEEVNARGDWACPRCRALCNCSNCRKKAGKEATGQLANIAKKAGFGSVKDLLDKNPNAKAIQLPKLPGEAGAPRGGSGGGGGAAHARSASAAPGEGGEGSEAPKRAPPKRKAAVVAEAEAELIADEELPAREREMPEPCPLAAHRCAAGAGGAGPKRPRGGLAWTADAPEAVPLPKGRAGAELAEVLEFLQVFGPKLGFRQAPPLAALAAELVQHPEGAAAGAALLCPSPEESLVGAVHCRLLELVRAYWNVKGEVRAGAWQGVMRGYWAASQLSQRQALDLRWGHGPPAVAGEIFTRPQLALGAQEEGCDEAPSQAPGAGAGEDDAPELGAGGAAAAATVDYPAGGYWALPAAARVGMLHALVHDALETDELRTLIEGSMGDALDEEKERRQQLAGVRKEARVAIARERDQQIALMIANATGGLTLEQQQELLEQARQRAEAAATSAAAAKVKALTEKVHPPTVRAAVLGADREGRRYLALQAAPLLTGDGGLVVQAPGADAPATGGSQEEEQEDASSGQGGASSGREAYGGHPAAALAELAAALHPRGRREGPLRAAIARTFKLHLPDAAAGSSQQEQEQADEEGEQQQQQQQQDEAEPMAVDEPEQQQDQDQQQQQQQQPALMTAPVPGNGRRATAARRKQSPPVQEPAAEAAPAAEAPKRGRKKGGSSSKSASPATEPVAAAAAADEAAAAAPAGGKRRRGSSEAGSSAERAAQGSKRQKAAAAAPSQPAEPAEAPAAGKRGGRRASPRAAADKPAAAAGKPARATRGRKAAAAAASEGAQLPLKVDDMLTA